MYTVENYTFDKRQVLGRGSFSTVFLAVNNITKTQVALKIIDRKVVKPHIIDKLTKEIEILTNCTHPNVLKLDGVVNDNKCIYIATELCHGTLMDIIKKRKVPEEEVLYFMRQLKNGMKYLIDNNIVHRDIKPQNLLITYADITSCHGDYKSITLKIADFGFSRFFESPEDMFNTICTSPLYGGPEIFLGQGNVKSDLWSIGIIIFQLLFNKLPYASYRNIKDILSQVNKIEIPSEGISIECYDLLKKLLQLSVTDRIEWNDFFSHEWFDSVDVLDSKIDDTMYTSCMDAVESSICKDLKNKMNIGTKEQKDENVIYKTRTNVIDDYCDRKMASSVAMDIPVCRPVPTANMGSFRELTESRNNSLPLYSKFNTFYRILSTSITTSIDKISTLITDDKKKEEVIFRYE